MTNLLRKCENCVFSYGDLKNNYIICKPKLPGWVYTQLTEIQDIVNNYEAEDCPTFRLRETGVNE